MGLKVSKELDEKYEVACRLCLEKHKQIYGTTPSECMFKHVDGEYCNDIETAERIKNQKHSTEDNIDEFMNDLNLMLKEYFDYVPLCSVQNLTYKLLEKGWKFDK